MSSISTPQTMAGQRSDDVVARLTGVDFSVWEDAVLDVASVEILRADAPTMVLDVDWPTLLALREDKVFDLGRLGDDSLSGFDPLWPVRLEIVWRDHQTPGPSSLDFAQRFFSGTEPELRAAESYRAVALSQEIVPAKLAWRVVIPCP